MPLIEVVVGVEGGVRGVRLPLTRDAAVYVPHRAYEVADGEDNQDQPCDTESVRYHDLPRYVVVVLSRHLGIDNLLFFHLLEHVPHL